MTDPSFSKRQQWRSRFILVMIFVLFFSAFGMAALLRFSGWSPSHTKNFGLLIKPPLDLSTQVFQQANGVDLAWQPMQNRWRIAVVSKQPCLRSCQQLFDTLHRVWLSQGRHADTIDVLWFAALPASFQNFKGLTPMRYSSSLAAQLPEQASLINIPVYVIDPSGFLILHYPAGFDPSGLRKDLAKLVK